MKPRSAIKADLFADEHHRKKIDSLGGSLADIESHIDFASLAAEVDACTIPCDRLGLLSASGAFERPQGLGGKHLVAANNVARYQFSGLNIAP